VVDVGPTHPAPHWLHRDVEVGHGRRQASDRHADHHRNITLEILNFLGIGTSVLSDGRVNTMLSKLVQTP
jgi:hypothetical protein